MLTATQRRLALAGVVGPVAFMVAWIVGGLVVRGYSSVHFSVSRLAAVGVSYRWMMVTALVVLGVGLLLYAPSLRSALPGLAWITATATGVSSLALVAYPLHARATPMHNVWAAAAYLGIASTPIFAYRPFAEAGMMSAARLSAGAGVIAGACLELTVIAPWPVPTKRLHHEPRLDLGDRGDPVPRRDTARTGRLTRGGAPSA